MKKFLSISTIALFGVIVTAFTANYDTNNTMEVIEVSKVPSVVIQTLESKAINSEDIISSENPTLLVFWATCCAPCKKELLTISKVYEDWKKETGVNIVAISVDLPQYANGVAPFVNKYNWDFDVYLDVKRNLMHKMNAYSTPHSFLINKTGEIVWEKQGFVYGDEKAIIEKIKELK